MPGNKICILFVKNINKRVSGEPQIAQSIKGLPCKHKDLSLIFRNRSKSQTRQSSSIIPDLDPGARWAASTVYSACSGLITPCLKRTRWTAPEEQSLRFTSSCHMHVHTHVYTQTHRHMCMYKIQGLPVVKSYK